MNIYYNERLIGTSEKDIKEAGKIIDKFLKEKGIISDYMRYVGLDNGQLMVDYGSWSNFFYIDCPFEELFKRK